MVEATFKSFEFKLYLSREQGKTLASWLRQCCWIYNRCLEQKSKAWKRRKESVSSFGQTKMLTAWRSKLKWLTAPATFQRSAIRRVDESFKSFFRRCKAGDVKVGYPRFKSSRRYRSMEYYASKNYLNKNRIKIPGLNSVRANGPFGIVSGSQKCLRIVCRASGWYAQIICEQQKSEPLSKTGQSVGIDLGLLSFITTDTGDKVGNPRLLRNANAKLKRAQQSLSRKQKGSKRRKKSALRVALIHERVANQRKGFCHRLSKDIVSRFDRIAIEDLNVNGLSRGLLAKSVNDASWSIFTYYLTYKAANAGRELVKVDPRYTSQTCPGCGAVKKKELSERQHNCSRCHLSLDRDHAAAIVVRDRAFRHERGENVRQGLAPAVLNEA